LDVRLPGLSGIALLEEMQREGIGIPVIMLTGHGDIPMSVQAMKLGAVDFITKPYNTQDLLDLVQKVLRTPSIQNRTIRTGLDPHTAQRRWQTLTPREQEVFNHIVSGSSNKVIGIDLDISIRTVETHRARIMEKLEANTLVDLVMLSMSLKDSA
jgi:FixJ family two-component response regulator